jgi:hypothetical protein
MREANGYSIITSPGQRSVEHDLSCCAHCHGVQFMKAGFGHPQIMIFRADTTHYLVEAHRCRNCFQFVCPKSECQRECVPFEKKLDAEERAARFFCS